jgi:hypothetical protein
MLQFSRAILAGATDTPVSAMGWQFEFLPWPANVKVGLKTTAVGVTVAMFSGSQTIQETSTVSVGGAAGVPPNELNIPFTYFAAAAGDRLKIVLVNTTAGTLTVDGVIIAEPAY